MAADGSAPPRPLATLRDHQASYSPDGHSIAFSSGQFSPECRIFLAQADGTRRRKPPDPSGVDRASSIEGCFRPAFMPDGRRVVFFLESWPTGPTGVPKENLWEIDIENGRSREIADYTLFDDPLNWRPKAQNAAKKP